MEHEYDEQFNAHEAAQEGLLSELRKFVDKDPNVVFDSESDEMGWTPLISAARMGRLDCVEFLLDRGADINHKAKAGNKTALIMAAYSGHTAVVKRLVERGADVSHVDNVGLTALSVAQEMRKNDASYAAIVEYLAAHV